VVVMAMAVDQPGQLDPMAALRPAGPAAQKRDRPPAPDG
jgi:hypothetical protein